MAGNDDMLDVSRQTPRGRAPREAPAGLQRGQTSRASTSSRRWKVSFMPPSMPEPSMPSRSSVRQNTVTVVTFVRSPRSSNSAVSSET